MTHVSMLLNMLSCGGVIVIVVAFLCVLLAETAQLRFGPSGCGAPPGVEDADAAGAGLQDPTSASSAWKLCGERVVFQLKKFTYYASAILLKVQIFNIPTTILGGLNHIS